MTTYALPITNKCKVSCTVESEEYGIKYSGNYTGYSGLKFKSGKGDDKRELVKRAIMDCIAQHLYNRDLVEYREKEIGSDNLDTYSGNANISYKVTNINFGYSSEVYRVKRIKINNKYYTQARDKKTGKIVGTYKNSKYKYTRDELDEAY